MTSSPSFGLGLSGGYDRGYRVPVIIGTRIVDENAARMWYIVGRDDLQVLLLMVTPEIVEVVDIAFIAVIVLLDVLDQCAFGSGRGAGGCWV